QGQEQKAITIVANNPEDLAKLQKKLDEIYARHPELKSEKPIIPSGTDKVVGESGRVAIARDFYPGTADAAGHAGAKLDPGLAEKIHADPSLEHDASGKLTEKSLRQVEENAGLKSGSLTYDKEGNLMLKAGADKLDPAVVK